jgi:hypothetical protein
MSTAVTSKLTSLSNQYSASVKELSELKAKLRSGGAGVSDAEAKRLNGLIKTVDAKRLKLMEDYNKLKKLEKPAKDYISISGDIKDIQAQINKAKARGENTASLQTKLNTLTSKFNAIAPKVEAAFPEIKIKLPSSTSTEGPLNSNYYTGKGTTANPFLQSGKPFTGTYNNRKYKDGIEVAAAAGLTPADNKVITDKAAADKVITDKTVDDKDKEKVKTAAELEDEALNTAAEKDFALPETLFKNIPSLNALLKKYVSEKWTPDKLRKAIRDDLWFKQNSAEIKTRYVQYYNFRDLQASGQATGSTDYELQIAKIEANLKKRATEIGSAAASDPAALRKAAENLYITNRSEDTAFVDSFLAASIRTIAGTIGGKTTQGYSGQALDNYKLLVTAARDNGFQVSDIIPGGASEQQVLQGIAAGTIDIDRVIADARKLAAQGQPQYVRDLLAQGYSLKQVFAPYRTTMANILEIDDPNQIDLNDPVLRSAITDKGDMNVYDFKKLLRRDDRWQYTEQARQDVSTAALDVLRDFGFQG